MKPLTLRLRSQLPCVVDASVLVPHVLAGKKRGEIERLSVLGWNQSFAVGDVFAVAGDDPSHVVLEGSNGQLIRVGAGLQSGALTVAGNAGDYAGESMRGGTLLVQGDAGDYAGAGMRGGTLTISGNAGSFTGSGRAGEMQGMSGGCIVVHGDAGDRTGDRMRRGMLLIEGSAASYCASRMVAGTMVVLGHVGTHPGYLMRRGTLILANRSVELLPTFNHNGEHELLAIPLLLDSMVQYGAAFKRLAQRRRFGRWLGDLGCEGKGEILLAR